MEAFIEDRVNQWLSGNYDNETKSKILELKEKDKDLLFDSFYTDLTFGTGGMRGKMGVGPNRMNKYTIGAATQGLSNYLKKVFPNKSLSAAIAYDSRINSNLFAQITANIFTANGIKVFLFENLRPTPELSFAIRELKCDTGVVITASHNPKEYNGYKVYWNDGSQIVSPHDQKIIEEIQAIKAVEQIHFNGNEQLVNRVGSEIDEAYWNMLDNLVYLPNDFPSKKNLKVVYTPIHGAGIMLMGEALKRQGFENVLLVEEQSKPNGNFPTVNYPNPEEKEALTLALKKATDANADIVLANDPDADRVGVAARDSQGELHLINGNEMVSLVFHYILSQRRKQNKGTSNDFIVKTIVTTDLINRIADHFNVNCYDTLTGFKHIANLIREKEGVENYVVGGEESYGLLIGDKIRDKDGISAAVLISEMAAQAKSEGKTLVDKLMDIYIQFGFYMEKTTSIYREGKKGAEEIAEIMEKFRKASPNSFNGEKVITQIDYLNLEKKSIGSEIEKISFPKSNVLQFITDKNTKVSIRPSGTEPKIKYYISANDSLDSKDKFQETKKSLEQKITAITEKLGI